MVQDQALPTLACDCSLALTQVIKSEKDEKQHIYYTVKFLGENQSAKIKEEDIKPFDMGVPEFTPSAQILSKHKDLGKALLKAKEIF